MKTLSILGTVLFVSILFNSFEAFAEGCKYKIGSATRYGKECVSDGKKGFRITRCGSETDYCIFKGQIEPDSNACNGDGGPFAHFRNINDLGQYQNCTQRKSPQGEKARGRKMLYVQSDGPNDSRAIVQALSSPCAMENIRHEGFDRVTIVEADRVAIFEAVKSHDIRFSTIPNCK